jgi:hypothetical protein
MDMPDESLSAGTLIDGARIYAAAEDAVNQQLPNALHVLSHLLCTSIELALKAYLRHSGYAEKQLRSLGHDLRKLLQHSSDNGLTYTGSRSFVLAVAGHNYRERLFVYPESGTMNVIMPGRLRQMCNELVCEAFSSIKGIETLQSMDREPGLCIQSIYPKDINASAWATTQPRWERPTCSYSRQPRPWHF